jgi:hypothetical protein
MNARQRAERALRHAPIMPTAKEAVLTFIEMEIVEAEREAIKEFVNRVETRAEGNMEKTGKLEGAHYAAMKAELDIMPGG